MGESTAFSLARLELGEADTAAVVVVEVLEVVVVTVKVFSLKKTGKYEWGGRMKKSFYGSLGQI